MYKIIKDTIKSNKRGITLLALAVTIIVLLILAGVVINLSLGEEGIFRRAQKGTERYHSASINEKIEINNVSNYIEDYLNELNKEKISDIEKAIQEETVFTVNTIIHDSYKNSIKIPAGFKLAKDSGKNVLEGIVIEDVKAGDETSQGNQFVWIPIGDIKINESGEIKKVNLGRYEFETNTEGLMKQVANDYENIVDIDVGQEYKYQELISGGENTGSKNLKNFISKAKSAGGYYIGRYETGDSEATIERTENSSDNIKPVIKNGKYPYTFITQLQAAELSRNLYNNNNFESDLINSYAWDTAVVYIQKFSEDNDYSKQTCLQNTLATTGKAHDENNNYDVRCNIYDMAGNIHEWSTETFNLEGYNCTARGGTKDWTDRYVAGRYATTTNDSNGGVGFRVILYV